ncbi:MAG TPA: hypothetical protein PKO07_03145, partial [Pseudomonadota bacterium]|nr:hypothetical protein [Pseudomonadota bacterium]
MSTDLFAASFGGCVAIGACMDALFVDARVGVDVFVDRHRTDFFGGTRVEIAICARSTRSDGRTRRSIGRPSHWTLLAFGVCLGIDTGLNAFLIGNDTGFCVAAEGSVADFAVRMSPDFGMSFGPVRARRSARARISIPVDWTLLAFGVCLGFDAGLNAFLIGNDTGFCVAAEGSVADFAVRMSPDFGMSFGPVRARRSARARISIPVDWTLLAFGMSFGFDAGGGALFIGMNPSTGFRRDGGATDLLFGLGPDVRIRRAVDARLVGMCFRFGVAAHGRISDLGIGVRPDFGMSLRAIRTGRSARARISIPVDWTLLA